MPILSHDPIYAKILSNGIKTVSFRDPTLGQTLSPSLYSSLCHPPYWLQFKGSFRCGSNANTSRKVICIHSTATNEDFKSKSFIICNARFLVYIITCDLCSLQYSDVTSLYIQGVGKVIQPKRGGNRFRILCKQDVYWIFKFNTRKPSWLNHEWVITYFYE